MMKILLTVAVLGSVSGFAGLALAQGKQGEAPGSDVSSLVARMQAQCAHRRRTMPPDARDGCANNQGGDAQLGYGQGGASAGNAQAGGLGPGGGQGNGIGPGGGQGNGIG